MSPRTGRASASRCFRGDAGKDWRQVDMVRALRQVSTQVVTQSAWHAAPSNGQHTAPALAVRARPWILEQCAQWLAGRRLPPGKASNRATARTVATLARNGELSSFGTLPGDLAQRPSGLADAGVSGDDEQ